MNKIIILIISFIISTCFLYGQTISEKDEDMYSINNAVDYARYTGDENKIKALLSRGVNINAKEEKDGWTALHMAVADCNIKNIKLLLKYKASKYVKTNDGRTLFDFIKTFNCSDEIFDVIYK